MAHNVQWDLILLDISMPNKNGIETLITLRDMGIQAPILIISFQADYSYEMKLTNLGASGYISKENLSAELIPTVYKVLQRDFLSIEPHKKYKY